MSAKSERILLVTAAGLEFLRASQLSALEYRTLWAISSAVTPVGAIISQSNVAAQLRTSVPYINQTLKQLCTSGLVLREERVGQHFRYRLNPAYFRLIGGSNDLAQFN